MPYFLSKEVLNALGFDLGQLVVFENDGLHEHITYERVVEYRTCNITVGCTDDNSITLWSEPAHKESRKYYFTGWLDSDRELIRLIEQLRLPLFTESQQVSLKNEIVAADIVTLSCPIEVPNEMVKEKRGQVSQLFSGRVTGGRASQETCV